MPGPLVKTLVAYKYGDQDILQRVAEILTDGTMAFKVDLINADWDIGNVHLLNIANAKINPATEGTLLAILSALGGSTLGDAVYMADDATSVASGSETPIIEYTVPTGKVFYFRWGSASGTNFSKYRLYVDGTLIRTRRSHEGSLNVDFNFDDDQTFGGVKATVGQKVKISVEHDRPWVGDYEADMYGRLMVA